VRDPTADETREARRQFDAEFAGIEKQNAQRLVKRELKSPAIARRAAADAPPARS
jgi:hypothetical protein